MELSQSRPFETAQGMKATHDFLSLCTHSSVHVQQDPRPSHGGFLKTHNFLQPLEREEKNAPKEDNSLDINLEKPQQASLVPSAVEHQLPGGIGTYSINHISYFNPRLPKLEENVSTVTPGLGNDRNDKNSNCSSYTGSGFTLWDESATRKRNSGKENMGNVNILKETTSKERPLALDRPTQSSSNRHRSVSPLSSSQELVQKSPSSIGLVKSATYPYLEDNETNLSFKRANSSSQTGELQVKVDGNSCDQKANTPRSKHSATEQRRRCKINDRFQMLRGLIPHSDQKRDKASFLSEVIEYIQLLQEKVNRYEGSYPGWNSEPTKLIPWRNPLVPSESLANQPRDVNSGASPMLMFDKAADVSLNIPRNTQILTEPNVAKTIDFKTVDQKSGVTYKTVSSSLPSQLDVYAPISNNCGSNQPSTSIPADGDDGSLAQLKLWNNRISSPEPTSTANILTDQQPALGGGTISISSIYSQGLLNSLTRALQSSGVDLSQASVSVQVDVGKRAMHKRNGQDPTEKKIAEAPSSNQAWVCARVESTSSESNHMSKRLKTG